MNRKITTAIFVLMLSGGLQAGEVKAMFGPNWSKYLFSDEVDALTREQKSGAAIGVGWVFSLAAKMQLEADVLYNEKGARAALEYAPGKTISGYYKNTSLSFPFLFKYRLKETASAYAALGPEFAFILSHQLIFPDSGDRYDLSASTKKFILGYCVLLGYEYPVGQWRLSAEVRYNRWLSDLLPAAALSVKSESVSILLGGAYVL